MAIMFFFFKVIDDSRKWWKVRNSMGNLGYAPYTMLMPYNFDMQSDYTGRETDSPVSSMFDNDVKDQKPKRPVHALTLPIEHEPESKQIVHKSSMPRSISMPTVPVPPPMPPPSANNTPSGTMKRNGMVAGSHSSHSQCISFTYSFHYYFLSCSYACPS